MRKLRFENLWFLKIRNTPFYSFSLLLTFTPPSEFNASVLVVLFRACSYACLEEPHMLESRIRYREL